METKQRKRINKKIVEIFGLETDNQGNKNMLLDYDENGNVVEGVDFTNEVTELTQFFEDEINLQ